MNTLGFYCSTFQWLSVGSHNAKKMSLDMQIESYCNMAEKYTDETHMALLL